MKTKNKRKHPLENVMRASDASKEKQKAKIGLALSKMASTQDASQSPGVSKLRSKS